MKTKRNMTKILAAVLALVLVVGTLAYYTSTNKVENQMQTKAYGDTLVEEFTPKNDWQPGEKADKIVGVTNTGDYPLVVRIKMSETWAAKATPATALISFDSKSTSFNTVNATTLMATQGSATDGALTSDQSVVYKEILAGAGTKWTYNSADGYWYYTEQLAAGASTDSLLKSITLAKNVDIGVYTTTNYYTHNKTVSGTVPSSTTTNTNPATGWVKYTGSVPIPAANDVSVYTRSVSALDATKSGYANANYSLIITSETCQATSGAVDATWTGVPAAVKTGWSLT